MPTIDALVLQRHVGGRLDLHVLEVLLDLPRPHAGADDVEERERRASSELSMIRVLKSSKLRHPERPGVGHRGHADAQREAIRAEVPRSPPA